MRLPCCFLRPRGQKIKNITKIEHKRLVIYIHGLIFYGVSHAKTDLHNKYMIWLFVSLIFWTRLSIKPNYFRSSWGKMT